VYYGTASHNYSNVTPVGANPSTVLSSLINGYTYFITVTAVAEDGNESDFSDEVSYLVPGGNSPPLDFRNCPAGRFDKPNHDSHRIHGQ